MSSPASTSHTTATKANNSAPKSMYDIPDEVAMTILSYLPSGSSDRLHLRQVSKYFTPLVNIMECERLLDYCFRKVQYLRGSDAWMADMYFPLTDEIIQKRVTNGGFVCITSRCYNTENTHGLHDSFEPWRNGSERLLLKESEKENETYAGILVRAALENNQRNFTIGEQHTNEINNIHDKHKVNTKIIPNHITTLFQQVTSARMKLELAPLLALLWQSKTMEKDQIASATTTSITNQLFMKFYKKDEIASTATTLISDKSFMKLYRTFGLKTQRLNDRIGISLDGQISPTTMTKGREGRVPIYFACCQELVLIKEENLFPLNIIEEERLKTDDEYHTIPNRDIPHMFRSIIQSSFHQYKNIYMKSPISTIPTDLFLTIIDDENAAGDRSSVTELFHEVDGHLLRPGLRLLAASMLWRVTAFEKYSSKKCDPHWLRPDGSLYLFTQNILERVQLRTCFTISRLTLYSMVREARSPQLFGEDVVLHENKDRTCIQNGLMFPAFVQLQGALLLTVLRKPWFETFSLSRLIDDLVRSCEQMMVQERLSQLHSNNDPLNEETDASIQQTRHVLNAVQRTLLKSGFHGAPPARYGTPDPSFFDSVLIKNEALENREGIPISLCLLFSTILCRMGYLAKPLASQPRHITVRVFANRDTLVDRIVETNKNRTASDEVAHVTSAEIYRSMKSVFIDCYHSFTEMYVDMPRVHDLNNTRSFYLESFHSFNGLMVLSRQMRNLFAYGVGRDAFPCCTERILNGYRSNQPCESVWRALQQPGFLENSNLQIQGDGTLLDIIKVLRDGQCFVWEQNE